VAIPINEYLRHNISNEALSLIYKDSVLKLQSVCYAFADININYRIAIQKKDYKDLSKMAILISKAQHNLK
jgi:hypothetical protein